MSMQSLMKALKGLWSLAVGLRITAVELVKPMAVKYEGFPTQQYENLVKQIKDAMAQK